MHLKPSIDFSAAKALISAGLECARECGVAVSVAVVDEAGEFLAFARMDGARAYTVELASEKAKAAAKLGLSTAALESLGRRSSSGNPWTAGGLPVLHDGQCAGAIGISGARTEIDHDIAERAVAAFAVP